MLTSELMKANHHIEFLSNLTGQKTERFGTQKMKNQLEMGANQNSSNVLIKPIVYNQNVIAYMNNNNNNSSTNDNSSSFLPQIDQKSDNSLAKANLNRK